MAYVPWWQKVADMSSQQEREEFMKGVFGFRPNEKRPNVAALIAGTTAAYLAGGAVHAAKAKKKK